MHLSLALLVIAVLGIGLTVAFFTDTEGALNRVTVGEINITTGED
ncbi:MAG: SipW-dependent-type signal peptide-containing protein, partial [Lachnospiraceae bacterium]|nr:SipW-dependent-type signal peptide-containing protein [Lachnospiraceae bacterium]